MRAQDSVDVGARRQRIAERVGTNGQMPRILDAVEPFPRQPDSRWTRFWNAILPSPEVLEVSGRPVNGFVVPTWAAGVILSAILGSVAFLYTQIGNQRDMLIRLDTQLQERDKHELEYREEFKTKTNIQALQIENMSSELRAIRAVLTPQQLKAIQKSPKSEN